MGRSKREIAALEFDVDLRLAKLWSEIIDEQVWDLATVACFMRAAYAKGYIDALAEKERGELCKAHGYPIPKKGDGQDGTRRLL